MGGNLSVGDKVMVKGINTSYGVEDGYSIYYNTFEDSTAFFNVEGNIMSLLYGDDFSDKKVFDGEYVFVGLFRETNIVNAQNLILPAITATTGCYSSMFDNCTSLTTAPELPATTLTGANLNTSIKGCYSGMFAGCESLVTAPELPAATLTQYCYYGMFYGCSNLSYVKCLATNHSANGCTDRWLGYYNNGKVSSEGTFVKASGVYWAVGTHAIPEGWVVVEE